MSLVDRFLIVCAHVSAYACVSLMLACTFASTAECAPAQDAIEQLVRQLVTPKANAQAATELARLPAKDVAPVLVRTMRVDAGLASNASLRVSVYRVLADLGRSNETFRNYTVPEQVDELMRGLSDPEGDVRRICLTAMRYVDKSRQAEVAEQVAPFLRGGDLSEIWTTVQILGDMGPTAREALPELRRILVADDKELTKRWKEARAQESSSDGKPDIEVNTRESAAHARMYMDGLGVDLDLYPELDMRGQWAALRALRQPLLQLVGSKANPGAPIVKDGDYARVVGFLSLASHNTELLLDGRSVASELLGWIALSSRVPIEVRRTSVTELQTLAKDQDKSIRERAASYIQRAGDL